MTSSRLFVESMPQSAQTEAGLLLVGEYIFVGSRRGWVLTGGGHYLTNLKDNETQYAGAN